MNAQQHPDYEFYERDEEPDDRFGLCPVCHQSGRYTNLGTDHHCFCETHRMRWFAGSNLFSSWRDETEAEQVATWEQLGLDGYLIVEPYRKPSKQCPPPRIVADALLDAV